MSLLPANTVDDDVIEVYADETRSQVLLRWQPLRLQSERPVVDGVKRPNRSLADFVAPKSGPGAKPDYIGLFAVTAGLNIEKKARQFEAEHDDYSAIMLKALADRLAEAFAEHLHQRVRTELWAYAPDEALSTEQLIKETYRGIRPAPGYPACPDHAVKRAMFDVLDAQDIGMALTESLAMTPAASVSGFYLAHPEARYFNVGKIGKDQLDDYARRFELDAAQAARALASVV
jgi:5-methyltetrahydrofolate--homocysteine methyltransferase